MRKIISILALCMLCCIATSSLHAQAPRSFSYQGYISDASHAPVMGVHSITVKLYDSPVEGSLLHSETFTTTLDKGVFNVVTTHFNYTFPTGVNGQILYVSNNSGRDADGPAVTQNIQTGNVHEFVCTTSGWTQIN
jgi:hypothetical protein